MDVEYTETDYAWAAGFLDGEGCFNLSKRNGLHETTRSPVLHAGQNDRRPLDKLSDMFGGTVREFRVTSAGNQAHQWALSGADDIRRVIPLIAPYLVEKQDRALAILAYAQTIHRRGKRSLTPLQLAQRYSLIRRYEQTKEVTS